MTTVPEPFNVDLEVFLAGESRRELDVDKIFAKDFERVLSEFKEYAPEDIVPDSKDAGVPSLFWPQLRFVEVPAGILLIAADGLPIGGYLSCDLSLSSDWQGRGLGAEIVIERCLRDGEVPTWNLDAASYSPAGLAAHQSAWRHVRKHDQETELRVRRLKALGYEN